MNMTHVTEVNGIICEMIKPNQIRMYGRKKMVYWKNHKMVENNVLTGKWTRTIIGYTVVYTPTHKPSKWQMLMPIMGRAGIALMIILVSSIIA